MQRGYQNARVLINDQGHEIRSKIEYADYMVFNQLTEGNYFGSRVLVPFEHYCKVRRRVFGEQSMERYYPLGQEKRLVDKEPEEQYFLKSLLSVVADSHKVEVWILDRTHMDYLPEKVLS
jgi:hypothetical protein